jgi:phosphate acetyltransferase
MSEFINTLIQKAKTNPKRIGFPESYNVDILKTAEKVFGMGMGTPVLIGEKAKIHQLCHENNISLEGMEIFEHTDETMRNNIAEEYVKKYDDFSSKAILRKTKDSVRCALFLLRLNLIDCVAAGKEYSTGDVIFESMSIVGMEEDIESVSSLGIAEIPGFKGPEGEMLALADCAITAQPDAEDLAGIAIASADTVRNLLGWEPRVGMLAFSTCNSAEHESIDVIREAIEKVKQRRPEIKIDGEFQLDAAILPAVAMKKVTRDSSVAGKANVLIFPNLHAGNIGVKLIQIFGNANAYGPILQGFARPVCDFSRSAPIEEMLGNIAMLVIRAGDMEATNEY